MLYFSLIFLLIIVFRDSPPIPRTSSLRIFEFEFSNANRTEPGKNLRTFEFESRFDPSLTQIQNSNVELEMFFFKN